MNKEDKRAITPEVASERYGIPTGTLANLRSQKRGCRFFKVGRRVIYRVEDFEKWLTSSPVQTLDSIQQ
jgi:hypothetical protein